MFCPCRIEFHFPCFSPSFPSLCLCLSRTFPPLSVTNSDLYYFIDSRSMDLLFEVQGNSGGFQWSASCKCRHGLGFVCLRVCPGAVIYSSLSEPWRGCRPQTSQNHCRREQVAYSVPQQPCRSSLGWHSWLFSLMILRHQHCWGPKKIVICMNRGLWFTFYSFFAENSLLACLGARCPCCQFPAWSLAKAPETRFVCLFFMRITGSLVQIIT